MTLTLNRVQSLKIKLIEIYTHHSSVTQMEQCLVDFIKEEIKEKLEKSDFVGKITDETLNSTLDKKLIRYALAENNDVETIFLRNYTTDNGTAECAAGYALEIEEWSIVIRQVDRASVTTGQHNGVGV